MRIAGILFAIIFIPIASLHAQVQVNLGLDFPGEHKCSCNGNSDIYSSTTGVSSSLEAFFSIGRYVKLGPGLEYQFEREVKDDSYGDFEPKFRFVPLYLTTKIGLLTEGSFIPELNLHIGYNFIHSNFDYAGFSDVEGGLYFAAGGGIVIYDHFVLDLLYRYQQAYIESGYENCNYTKDVTQTQFTLQIGARL